MEGNSPARNAHVELVNAYCPLNEDAYNEDPASLLSVLRCAVLVKQEDGNNRKRQVDVHAHGVGDGHGFGIYLQAAFHSHPGIARVNARTGNHRAGDEHNAQGNGSDRCKEANRLRDCLLYTSDAADE